MPHVRSPERLDDRRSGLLVIDVQEKLCPLIPAAAGVIDQIMQLIQVAKLVGVPHAATVQYPQGLGGLTSPLQAEFPSPQEKRDFTAAVCRDALDAWAGDGRDQIVVVGIETHVCVLHTVLDLLAEGCRPLVVVDAVAARRPLDHDLALDRMRDAGATLTTTESVMFEWLGSSTHPAFKAVSGIIKSRPR